MPNFIICAKIRKSKKSNNYKKMNFKDKYFVFLRFKSLITLSILLLSGVLAVSAQETAKPTPTVQPTPTASPTPAGNQNPNIQATQPNTAIDKNNLTAEQLAESTIFIYGGGLGRVNLDQIRKTTIERGKINTTDAKGKPETANYELLIMRGENLEKEKVRLDRAFPNSKFALISANEKVFGIFNNNVFAPREDALKEFQNRIWHGLEALLRYKENGSTLVLAGREKHLGVDFYLLDVTDKQNRKTRFFISQKSFRVMALEYTADAIKYKRKFYDYNYAQGTLVPYRTVLWADDKIVEEMSIQTISFGQKIENYMFEGS